MPDESEESSSFLEMELETLKSIYVNELNVENNVDEPVKISIDLFPSTADNIDERYVRITLIFNLSEQYPVELPVINIRNARGLSEEMLDRITQDLYSIAENKKGGSMLYELIEAAKEYLTTENRPSGQCVICLYGFSDTDVFTRTECFHYYHSHCLARYSLFVMKVDEHSTNKDSSEETKKELLCPMCRLPIVFPNAEVDYPPPTSAEEDAFAMNQEMCELQKKMADLFQKQIEKGGIIDIEAEKNKYYLEISNVPTSANTTEKLYPELPSETTEDGELNIQEARSSAPKSPNRSHEGVTKPRNHIKSAPNHKYRRPDDRNYDNRNNWYNPKRYNGSVHHREEHNNVQESYPNRHSKRFSERNRGTHRESQTKSKCLNSEYVPDSEECLDSKSFNSEVVGTENKYGSTRNRYGRGNRYNRKSEHLVDNDSETVLVNEENSESKALIQSDSEVIKQDSAVEDNLSHSRQFRDQRYHKRTEYDVNSSRQNYIRAQNNQSSHTSGRRYNYNYHNDRPNLQELPNQRRYQTNPRPYSHDDESYPSYAHKYRSEKFSDYKKPQKFNSRNSRFNESKQHSNEFEDGSVECVESHNETEGGNACVQSSIPNRNSAPNSFRRDMHQRGPRYSANSRWNEENNYHKPERYQREPPRKFHDNSFRNKRNFPTHPQPRQHLGSHDSDCISTAADVSNAKYNESQSSSKLDDSQVKKTTELFEDHVSVPFVDPCHNAHTLAVDGVLPHSINFPIVSQAVLPPPPGFANPTKKVIYGLSAANPPPGFHRS